MIHYYLAIDIGASSGRHILGHMEGGILKIEEIYRFENHMVKKGECLCWDTDRLLNEIVNGLAACNHSGKRPSYIGIDTWGVDYVLLDEKGAMIGDAVAYRDARTDGMDALLASKISDKDLYSQTGIQKQPYNTLYQLYAAKLKTPNDLDRASFFLMMPDYLNFFLTGIKRQEYTIASTTQLLDPVSCEWNRDLIAQIGLPRRLFGPISMPGTVVGPLTEPIRESVGFDAEVILPGCHDTASAVVAVPSSVDDFIFLSSGTWSLIGVERMAPDCSDESRRLNFTNEGGFGKRYRYLTNIMGLWMIQSLRREFSAGYNFSDFGPLAESAADFPSLMDVNDKTFLAPENMIEAIRCYCRRERLAVPETDAQLLACVYKSLAASYAEAVRQIERVTGRTYGKLHIVGGGCQDRYLNMLTAQYTGKEVYAGPIEATAIGNIAVQMMAKGELLSLSEAREVVARSFNIKKI
jgi:rhamnulokinase